jgi:type I pantothenate kinase
MEQRLVNDLSPFRVFNRSEWAKLRAGAAMTLKADEIIKLQSLNDRLSMKEVEEIYLPLARLLGMYVAASQKLFSVTNRFLKRKERKVPYIIGIAGSVAVGKSTTARVLQALLSRMKETPKVDLVTTDGFLFSNAVLKAENLMERKGFPQSYDLSLLLRFLSDVKAGKRKVQAPVYSHLSYDIVPDQFEVIDQPDVLILEGLNLFQVGSAPKDGHAIPFVSDFIDFSIYLDAEERLIHDWYMERFLTLRKTAFRDPHSFFHRFAALPKDEVIALAKDIWEKINGLNLRENILPTRRRANLILSKGADHSIDKVLLRRL